MISLTEVLHGAVPALIFLVAFAAMLGIAPGSAHAAEADNPKVLLKTSKGDITLELFAGKAPKTVDNFLTYVRDGHYDGTVFHRVINGFMIQGGGMDADLTPRPTREPIENEADNSVANEAYTIAMARTSDPHSATAQFFINVADNEFLNHKTKSMQGWGYCAFGRVIEGQEVVDAIKSVPTSSGGMHENVPVEAVEITSAAVVGD
jgi:peptidyl-prolyl cis-trans isomerase B (cyclophilin B)